MSTHQHHPLPSHQSTSASLRAVHYEHPRETLIEKLTRDLEAWRLAKGVIAKAKMRC